MSETEHKHEEHDHADCEEHDQDHEGNFWIYL